MSGAGLWATLLSLIVLCAVVAIFFLAIDKISVDAFMAKIAKIVVGVVALVIVLSALGALLFGGGGGLPAISAAALITFAVGILVVLVVIYLAYMAVDWFGFMVEPIKYVIGAVALIALLILAGNVLFGGIGFASLEHGLPRVH